MIIQIKSIIARGKPGNKKTKQAINDLGLLQAFYKRHTGRTMRGGCSCRWNDLLSAVGNIIQKNGL